MKKLYYDITEEKNSFKYNIYNEKLKWIEFSTV